VEFSSSFDVVGPILQICLIDLLLSGDNAILIAMACQHLPLDVRRKAVLLGTGVAVAFRVVLAFAATLALRAPYLKLIGAVLLLLIAIELLASDSADRKAASTQDPAAGIWKAIVLIVVADAVMSLDNVVAVAAAAQDNLLYLFLGLLLSVPILVFSSLLITRLLDAHPAVIQAGAALLGWVAGKTAVSDPAIAAQLEAQSFGLVALAPVLGAAYVLLQGRILREQRSRRGKPAAAGTRAGLAPIAAAAAQPATLVARTAPPAPPAAADGGGDAVRKKFSPMDLTIMAGVAAPLLGLLATLVYVLWHAVASH
jgi:YjbE family integral membrane protein